MSRDELVAVNPELRRNVSKLVNDAEIRRLAGEVAMASLQKNGAGAAARLPTSVQRSLRLSDELLRKFRREGLSALNPEQQTALQNALADPTLAELRRLGGTTGTIDARRANEVFSWLERFDSNGDADTIATVSNDDPTQLTPAGRVMARVVATQTAEVTFTERDFVAGFRNGVIDTQRLLNDAETRDILQKADILESLTQSVASGRDVQLTVPQLRALYRIIDKRDTNGQRRQLHCTQWRPPQLRRSRAVRAAALDASSHGVRPPGRRAQRSLQDRSRLRRG